MKWQPTPVFLPGKFHGQSNPAGYSPWSHKELDMTEQTQTNINIPHLLYPFLCWYLVYIYALSVVMQWTLGCVYLFRLWFSPDVWPRVRLLNHRNSSEFRLSFILFSIMAVPIYNLPNSVRGAVPFSSHPFQPFIVGRLLVKALLTGVRWYLIVIFICISDK